MRYVNLRKVLGNCLNWKKILVRPSKKAKGNVNFLFKLEFHVDRVEKKQYKMKLKKLLSLSS